MSVRMCKSCGAISGSFYGSGCFYCGKLLHPEEIGGENEKKQAEARRLDEKERKAEENKD